MTAGRAVATLRPGGEDPPIQLCLARARQRLPERGGQFVKRGRFRFGTDGQVIRYACKSGRLAPAVLKPSVFQHGDEQHMVLSLLLQIALDPRHEKRVVRRAFPGLKWGDHDVQPVVFELVPRHLEVYPWLAASAKR
jgi:hypothetical protein